MFLIQLHAHVSEKAVEDDLSSWALASHEAEQVDLLVPGFSAAQTGSSDYLDSIALSLSTRFLLSCLSPFTVDLPCK